MTFYFFRESNDFSDILSDPSIKKSIRLKIKTFQHLIISLNEYEENSTTESYIMLKYGESLTKIVEKDRTPIMYIDYIPKKPV
jgi:hypothetical protein